MPEPKPTTEVDAVEETATTTEEDTQEETTEGEETAAETADDTDYDALIDEEKKKGKPNPKIAQESFKDREARRKKEAGEEPKPDEEDEDRPLTHKDIALIRAEQRREVQEERATEIAKSLSGSDKEAELIVLRWKNRSFPEGTPLTDQIEEVLAGVHAKKLIGQRNEALRALKNKSGVKTETTTTQQSGIKPIAAKLKAGDKSGIEAAGYALVAATGMYEKSLSNGDKLVLDPKTMQSRHIKKGS